MLNTQGAPLSSKTRYDGKSQSNLFARNVCLNT
jgi:hypothetical protein